MTGMNGACPYLRESLVSVGGLSLASGLYDGSGMFPAPSQILLI
jgi:hypothetical protein